MQVMAPNRRLQVLHQQLCAGANSVQGGHLQISTKEKHEKAKRFKETAMQYMQSIYDLKEHGAMPTMTAWEMVVVQRQNQTRESASPAALAKAVAATEKKHGFALADLLPGPLKHAKTQNERMAIVDEALVATGQGWNVQLWAHWQQKYGDRGLSTNIVVPEYDARGTGSGVQCRVILADPEDAERISRVHTRKDGSFEPTLMDSIISTTDNEHWQEQRRHLSEVFMPLSSLAQIMPVSLARAKSCAERLSDAAVSGTPVDMSDFLLHEAQAQLQLALLGLDEDFMDATNADIRKTFMMHPEAPVGRLSEAMAHVMKQARESSAFSLPSDQRPVSGPLSRALQQSNLAPSADYGNALLILFAGHDTTGHAMTWLLFELSRHPEYQRRVQHEVDEFFRGLGSRDPEYRDLSSLDFLDRCITETLRLWNSVPNGTFRQLQFDDEIKGEGGKPVMIPAGTHVNVVAWSRHRNPDLWGEDANEFNPHRHFQPQELLRVGSSLAAATPQSPRFSPFTHAPRSCLGRNFAQMEMRLILVYLLRKYSFSLAPPYDELLGQPLGATVSDPAAFRGVNLGTMGPLNLHEDVQTPFGKFYTVGLKLFVHNRAAQ